MRVRDRLAPAISLVVLFLAPACGGDGDDAADAVDDTDDVSDAQDAPTFDADPAAPDAAGGNPLDSTLTATCATLQGRAIVNENGNLGASFTEADSPFTFIGSIQWELPDGFTGAVPNPENWDGNSPRELVGVTSPAFETFGSHCWLNVPPPAQPGTATIAEYDPTAGIVRATFTNFALHSCVGGSTCILNGSIETTGEGVFE